MTKMKSRVSSLLVWVLTVMSTTIVNAAPGEMSVKELQFQKIEANKDVYINFWNRHTKQIADYVNQDGCNMLLNQTYSPDLVDVVSLWCYAYEKWRSEHVVNTTNSGNRIYNIKNGLKTVFNDIVAPGETYSINKNVQEFTKYKNAWALFYNPKTKKVDVKEVNWGGLCWVSSVMYPAVMKNKNLEVTERWAHSNFYNDYYGKNLGWDATIYFWSKDFKFKNNSNQNLLIKSYHDVQKGRFVYSMQLIQPFTERQDITTGKSWKNKNWRTCNEVTAGWKTHTSCYVGVYK